MHFIILPPFRHFTFVCFLLLLGSDYDKRLKTVGYWKSFEIGCFKFTCNVTNDANSWHSFLRITSQSPKTFAFSAVFSGFHPSLIIIKILSSKINIAGTANSTGIGGFVCFCGFWDFCAFLSPEFLSLMSVWALQVNLQKKIMKLWKIFPKCLSPGATICMSNATKKVET